MDMSKFEDIKNSVWNLFRREAKTSKTAEEPASADERDSQETESWEDDNPSMISGEDPRIFGVRRQIVAGLFFCLYEDNGLIICVICRNFVSLIWKTAEFKIGFCCRRIV